MMFLEKHTDLSLLLVTNELRCYPGARYHTNVILNHVGYVTNKLWKVLYRHLPPHQKLWFLLMDITKYYYNNNSFMYQLQQLSSAAARQLK
jgi:hypothetical protein